MINNWLDIYDYLLAPIYFGIIIIYAVYKRNRNISKKSYYKYYVPAVLCKLIGGIGVCLVYTFYYEYGGDVTNYFLTTRTYVNTLYSGNFSLFWDMINFRTNNIHQLDLSLIPDNEFNFSGTDYYALLTVVLTIPFCILGSKCFLTTTMLLAFVSFIGLWKLYEVFIAVFPEIKYQLAISVFFVPSVFFWGSGLLKDTYTLSAVGFYTYSVYQYLILKNRKFKYLMLLISSSLIIVLIKPYIFFAILPGSLVWVFFNRILKIKNPILRTFALPIMLIGLSSIILVSLQYIGEYLGEYNLDNILNKAVKTQQDLIRGEQYGNNNFNIGKFEPTLSGIVSKIPVAINLALFRPYLWDARNPVMLLSGLENLFMLGFSIFILIKVKLSTLFKSLFSNPLLIFSFLFSLFFAFSVGLTTANYGALVRLKIPCIPFYLVSLFILYNLNKESFKRR